LLTPLVHDGDVFQEHLFATEPQGAQRFLLFGLSRDTVMREKDVPRRRALFSALWGRCFSFATVSRQTKTTYLSVLCVSKDWCERANPRGRVRNPHISANRVPESSLLSVDKSRKNEYEVQNPVNRPRLDGFLENWCYPRASLFSLNTTGTLTLMVTGLPPFVPGLNRHFRTVFRAD